MSESRRCSDGVGFFFFRPKYVSTDVENFDNFDFSLRKGKDVDRLKALPSLAAIYSHRNLAFIGPAGTGTLTDKRPPR